MPSEGIHFKKGKDEQENSFLTLEGKAGKVSVTWHNKSPYKNSQASISTIDLESEETGSKEFSGEEALEVRRQLADVFKLATESALKYAKQITKDPKLIEDSLSDWRLLVLKSNKPSVLNILSFRKTVSGNSRVDFQASLKRSGVKGKKLVVGVSNSKSSRRVICTNETATVFDYLLKNRDKIK